MRECTVFTGVCLSTADVVGGGTHPADQGGTPFPGLDGEYPIQLIGGTLPRSGWGVPLSQAGGSPPAGVLPPPDQHSMYLLRGGQCASCVHTGGLSCCYLVLNFKQPNLEQ